jgi:ubiquinone/menaquinone biosynthesis C-methylase UbiE
MWSKIEGNKILEVSAGTVKNLPYYPVHTDITTIDFSKKMLIRAREKAKKYKAIVDCSPLPSTSFRLRNV